MWAVAIPGTLPGPYRQPRWGFHGSSKCAVSHGMADFARIQGISGISRNRWLLPAVYPGVRHNSPASASVDSQGRNVEIDEWGTDHFWLAEEQHQFRTGFRLSETRKQYILDTDASGYEVGAGLPQMQQDRGRVIAFCSKTLTTSEHNYCKTWRKSLAVIKAVKHLRPYLYSQAFLVQTNHASLHWLCRRKEPLNQVAWWLEILVEFWYTLKQRSGPKHSNPNLLSRQTCEDCRQCTSIEQRVGGPSNKLAKELGQPATRVLTSCLNGTPALDKAGSNLGNIAYFRTSISSSNGTPALTVAKLNLGADGSSVELPAP